MTEYYGIRGVLTFSGLGALFYPSNIFSCVFLLGSDILHLNSYPNQKSE